MINNRRIGLQTSVTRDQLVDAVNIVIAEQGHASVTARTVAKKAGLKHQIVYYYFRSMEDLLLAAFRRRNSWLLHCVEKAMASHNPLEALWLVQSEPAQAALTVEYLALANCNNAIRNETVHFSETLRRAGIGRLKIPRDPSGRESDPLTPTAVTFAISSLAAVIGMEANLGITGGHEELRRLVEWCFKRLGGTSSTGSSDVAIRPA